ncbi:VC0807 family protein [Nocardioides pantholopis]|uniref:VC0807 family protein n=1 Tax=Nocardioides pantholopis TaxID=2483798 RepID=UPI000F0883A4|nr:VC0807 family protein [Nocardioides pantholopis]
MTSLASAPTTDTCSSSSTSTAAPPHRPSLPAVVRRVAASLAVACLVPATLFYVVMLIGGVWSAIVAALVWSYAAIVWRAATGRRISGLLVLVTALMTVRTVLSLVADSTYLYFLQPVLSDGVVAVAFLLSLVTARPLVARLAGDFYPMDRELHLRPRIRRLFRRLTLMWALLCLGKAGGTLWLLESTSVETFVLLKSVSVLVLNALAITATISAAALVARREGLLGPGRALAIPV